MTGVRLVGCADCVRSKIKRKGAIMARTKYKNGDEVGLSCGCDGCNPAMINGVLCHEHGCPYAWKDRQVSCRECGFGFYPAERGAVYCADCLAELEVCNA